jgi:hypothetical protein
MTGVPEITYWSVHNLVLEVRQPEDRARCGLAALLRDLNFDVSVAAGRPRFVLDVEHTVAPSLRLDEGQPILQVDGMKCIESGDHLLLTDGASSLELDRARGYGRAFLAPRFFDRPEIWRRKFWTFGLLKLLRSTGMYSLHAAGLVPPHHDDSRGWLIVARCGGGKSTLTLGLVMAGWRFLSDDAVLLRRSPAGIEALALRTGFYVNSGEELHYPGITATSAVPDQSGGMRRRLEVRTALPAQYVPSCRPEILLFSHIGPDRETFVAPLPRERTLPLLLEAGGPQLLDRRDSAGQLAVIVDLARQARSYEVSAGPDLKRDPLRVIDLLQNLGERWLGSLSSLPTAAT